MSKLWLFQLKAVPLISFPRAFAGTSVLFVNE